MKDRAVFTQIPNWGEKKSGKIAHEYVKMDGYTFDSQAEVDRYIELKLMQQKGIISELECQKHFATLPLISAHLHPHHLSLLLCYNI